MTQKIINNKIVSYIFGINVIVLSTMIIFYALDISQNGNSPGTLYNLCFLLGVFTGICFYRIVERPYTKIVESKE